MDWSPQQDRALLAVRDWLRSPTSPQIFLLFGVAGTGKTTLAVHFANEVEHVCYGAPTGKAACVMQDKGCEGATTIHRLIYNPKDKSKRRLIQLKEELLVLEAQEEPDPIEVGKLRRLVELEKQRIRQPTFDLVEESPISVADLVIIDEASMIDHRIGEDLLSFGTKILVLGDPAQLPPVRNTGYFTTRKPDVMLTEIHRQARENPIIDMATRVRLGEPLPLGTYGSSAVVGKGQLDPVEIGQAEQLLVGRNKTRHAANQRLRAMAGHTSVLPVAGDKVVCLRNDHDLGLMNGSTWNVLDSIEVDEEQVGLTVRDTAPLPGTMDVNVCAWRHHFEGRDLDMGWWDKKEAHEFDYGNALTVHKAQGSQWGDVVVVDESWAFREDHNRWLYTAITRASERVRVIRSE